MQCKFVRESMCMSYTFHPKSISLFSLVHFKNRLRIIQQNLYTGLVMNDFPVPLRQQKLQVDNYTVCYNEKLDIIIFTLSNRILIYSLQKKVLLVVLEATTKNSPLYITRTATRGINLFFSATEQKVVFGINIEQCIKNATISNYVKYKISANQAEINEITTSEKVLVALCNDRVLRIWDIQSSNALKGVAIENVGRPICFNFSKNDTYLILGTSQGFVQVWDGQTLGVKNIKMMSEKITKNILIQSICWFHYAGQSHSFRFLVLTVDGNVKLYSFWFQKKEKDDTYVGRCTQLSLLYNCRQQIGQNYMIKAHSFANFVFFNPGILLYMVDSHSLIYYPVVMKQPSASFDQLTPNKKKQIYYTRDILFMKGMQIKRLKDTIEDKVFLQDDLQYKQLKILRVDMRPWSNLFAPEISKIMVVYYLKNAIRVITLSKLNLNQKIEDIASYKQYSGSWIMFIGPKQYYQPFLLIVQEDKQTVTVLAQNQIHPHDLKFSTEQQKKYFNIGPGQIYTSKINIKIQKVYPTPFRNGYVVIYQTDNLLRFSNNINFEQELINYDVCTSKSLRLDYHDIILDVIWTSCGGMGAVICLDKVEIINSSLMSMRKFTVSGYIVQGQWIGYTLLITTKKDVQYCDIISKPIQAFCLQNLQSKYLIMRVMADRIIGAQRNIDGTVSVKARYFKIMEPLISGYLNYQYIAQLPIDQQKIKMIIQCFAPYFIVSEQFINLLNQKNLSSISKYFLQGNQKMYSKPLRAKTLNNLLKIQRFIPQEIWNKNKRMLLDLYLNYQQSKDSNDPYEVQIGKQFANKIKSIVGSIAFDSIKDLSSTEMNKGVTINNNFGQQSMYQLYYDINKQGNSVKMQIYPFKAQNCGEWLGQFGLYLQSKPYFDEQQQTNHSNNTNTLNNMMHQEEVHGQEEYSGQDDQNPFKNLVVYFRCDDGKGQTVQDLSNYNNNGIINEDSIWIPLQDQPMQLQDKWGKKCPPQFSLKTPITLSKKINTKVFFSITVQIWIKALKQDFSILKLGKQLQIQCKKLQPQIKLNNNIIRIQRVSQNNIPLDSWVHFALTINPKQNTVLVYINSQLSYQAKQSSTKIPRIPSSLQIGDSNNFIQYTQFRLWRKCQQQEQIKQNMRTPLQLVSQKRKRLRAKLKQKKKKSTMQQSVNPFSLD